MPKIELIQGDCMEELFYNAIMAHSEETKRKIGLANKGKLKGVKRDPESVKRGAEKRRTGKYFNCVQCDAVFWRKKSSIKKGHNKFCSKKCYQINQIGKPKSEAFKQFCRTRTGENSPTWKGGVTPEHLKIRNSKKYKEWRESVFIRDLYTCQNCGKKCGNGKNVYLHAHHIKNFSEHIA